MIGTVFLVSWLGLLRDRVALALTFVLPVVFFSIFAAVFSAMDADGLRAVRTILVVDPQSAFAGRLAERLVAEPAIDGEIVSIKDRQQAIEEVRRGRATAAVMIPADLTSDVELYTDRANPLGSSMIQGLVQSAAAATVIESLNLPGFDPDAAGVSVRVVDALGRTGKRPSIAFFAAGLGVMFLMFAVTGRSSVLLEEREHGVLSRLLAARVGLSRLLIGRGLFLASLGFVQVTVMFVWAAMVFGLELFTLRQGAGFVLVTLVTAVTAATFGLVLSALCRTRAQLNGVAVVVILTLSAIGGNMFPRFLMPEGLQTFGGWTFNAWALDAYHKVFWYERPLVELWPELSALVGAAVVFFLVARGIAGRWARSGGMTP